MLLPSHRHQPQHPCVSQIFVVFLWSISKARDKHQASSYHYDTIFTITTLPQDHYYTAIPLPLLPLLHHCNRLARAIIVTASSNCPSPVPLSLISSSSAIIVVSSSASVSLLSCLSVLLLVPPPSGPQLLPAFDRPSRGLSPLVPPTKPSAAGTSLPTVSTGSTVLVSPAPPLAAGLFRCEVLLLLPPREKLGRRSLLFLLLCSPSL